VFKLFTQPLRRHILVIAACGALCIGLAIARWFAPHHVYLLVSSSVLVAVWWVIYRYPVGLLITIVVVGVSLGWWRGAAIRRQLDSQAAYHLHKVTIIGKAGDEAAYDKRHQLEFTLSDVQLRQPTSRPLIGNVTIRGFGEV
jgi:hypothetical protein